MKKTKKPKTKQITRKRPSRTTGPVQPAGNRAPSEPSKPRAERDAPSTSTTAEFKAGRDL